jgi:hypothetical protein
LRSGPAAYRGGFWTPTAVTRLEITLRLFQVGCQPFAAGVDLRASGVASTARSLRAWTDPAADACWCRPCEPAPAVDECVAVCAVDGLDRGCDVRRASGPDVRVKVHRCADREAARTSHPTARGVGVRSSRAALRSKPPLLRRSHPGERYVLRTGSNETAPAATAANPDSDHLTWQPIPSRNNLHFELLTMMSFSFITR